MFGLDWLLKMWYYQVGIGDGNDNIIGDHDLWRLPQVDDTIDPGPDGSQYYIKYR